jgi:hypothetical protein
MVLARSALRLTGACGSGYLQLTGTTSGWGPGAASRTLGDASSRVVRLPNPRCPIPIGLTGAEAVGKWVDLLGARAGQGRDDRD